MKNHLHTSPVELIVFLCLGAFSVTSFFNVQQFVTEMGHAGIASWFVAAGLGVVLALSSYLLTKIDKTSDPSAFNSVLLVAICAGLISGAAQTSSYYSHSHSLPWSILLGVGIPLVGEVFLSLAAARYVEAEKRRQFRSIQTQVEDAVSEILVGSIANMDTRKIAAHVERTLTAMATSAVSEVGRRSMAVYGEPVRLPMIADEPATQVLTPAQLAEKRTEQAEERKARTLQLIQNGRHTLADIATEIGKTERTVERYIQQLREAGHNIVENSGVYALANQQI